MNQQSENRSISKLRLALVATQFLLVIEFLLGMFVNLFAALPVGHGSFFSGASFDGEYELLVHSLVGFALVGLSIATVVFASRSRRRNLVTLGGLGLLSVVVAGVSGLAFVFSGYQNDYESYLMSVAFLASIFIYFTIRRQT